MAILLMLILASLMHVIIPEYVPPGPAYPCPKDAQSSLLYPCVCTEGTDTGIMVTCENVGLAVLSVGLGNIASLGLPIEKLTLKDCKIANLFGPLFHRSTIRVIHIIDTPVKSIDKYAFAGVNRTLQELFMSNTVIDEFPAEAFKILSNLTTLIIDGHKMTKLAKDIFAGSEANGRLEKVRLVNGLLSEFPPETFQTLKKLKVLDLHSNRLANLKRNQFKGLRDTEVLDISHNNITRLDGQHIGDLTKLGWCNASHNLIGEIPRGMFARNTVLKVLHLNNNKIKKLDTNSFRGMRFLRRLFLQDNEISDAGRGTFAAVTRIGTVDLARNSLAKVDYQMFQQVKYAELINLAENKIKIIESQAFTDLYLAVVNISHNQLSTIEKGSFVNCQNMTVLDLSHNELSNITKDAFDANSYAGELIVSYNKFTDFSQIPIYNMTGIRLVNASFNSITTIPRNTFPKLYELHTVDVSHNNLSDIFNSVFQNLFSLRYLNLSHNSLTTLKPSTFGTLPTVLELDLSHNLLADMARSSLAKLASCRIIDLSFNFIERMFQIPISLGELNLSHNKLSSLPANSFPSMNALLRINLSNNIIQDSLEGHSFSNLVALNTLDLSSNGLTRPPWEALNVLSSLQYLYLQNNSLTSLSRAAFGNLPTLFHLDLSSNNITSTSEKTFTGLQQMSTLLLRGNKLSRLMPGVFSGLVALRHLDLSHNAIEKIDNKTNGALDDCLSLESVNLSHNNFTDITRKSFPSNPWIPYRLREVDLSHNQLYVLTSDVNVGTDKVRRLNLTGNNINDIRNNVLGNFTSLEVLDLSNNNIQNLISRNSEETFHLPSNLTELYLQNNILSDLPLAEILNATYLKLLDLRNNTLTKFYPGFVKKMKSNHLNVLFEGNDLNCDCYIRPLIHHLNHMSPLQLRSQQHYTGLVCSHPLLLKNENIMSVDEERFLCTGNISREFGNTEEIDFETEPDLAFRDIQYSQQSIYVHWFVNSNQDIADFYLYIRNAQNELIYTNHVSYTLRSITITLDGTLQTAFRNVNVKPDSDIDVCVQAKTSGGSARKWHARQCQKVPSDFESWPKKLSLDKRRLTKKKVRYSWFGNSVLGLVSDSILITLCIFLGVFLRRLNDFELWH